VEPRTLLARAEKGGLASMLGSTNACVDRPQSRPAVAEPRHRGAFSWAVEESNLQPWD